MSTLSTLKALGGIDFKNVRRDPMLAWLSVFSLGLALLMRWGVPPLTELLLRRYEFDLVPYYPMLLGFLALTMPAMIGAIIGFLLLDQKDDGTLSALQVTPLTLRGYLFYRTAAPLVVCVLITAWALHLTNLMTAGFGALVLDAVVAAPLGPIFALFVASLAANKVQGFAVMKGSSVISWPAIIAWFVPMPWQVALGIVPHYWIAKVVWVTEAGGNPFWFALVALVFQFGLLIYLLRLFDRVSKR